MIGQAQSVRPLPRGRRRLTALHGIVLRFLDEHGAYLQRQRQRLALLRDIQSSNDVAHARGQLLAATYEQVGRGVASIQEVVDYLDDEAASLAHAAIAARRRLANATAAWTFNDLFAVFSELIEVETALSAHFRRLEQAIADAIDAIGADACADTERFCREMLPINDDITRLYLRLLRNNDGTTPERVIALEFTNNDASKASSLLRGVRRLRKRIRSRSN